MKLLSFLAVILITSSTFYSCKKSDVSVSTHWTLKGTGYTSDHAGFAVKILTASDASGNSLTLYFSDKPTVGGAFTVKATSPSVTSQCSIIVSDATDDYFSTGAAGDVANVTVAGDGKLTVDFSGVTVRGFSGSDLQVVSGTIIEN